MTRRQSPGWFKALMIGAVMALLPLAATAQSSLSPDDAATMREVETYLANIDTLQAHFIQVSSDGAYAEGEVYVDRPGNMRFEYEPPVPILLLTTGSFLVHYDRDLKEATFLPLWETPLWFLLDEDPELGENVMVQNIDRLLGSITINLVQAGQPDQGSVTLIFEDSPMSLRKWEITDAQGVVTQVSLINPRFDVEIDQDLFSTAGLEIWSDQGLPANNRN